MELKALFGARNHRWSLVLGSPEVEMHLHGQTLLIQGPRLLLAQLESNRLAQVGRELLGIDALRMEETVEQIPVTFPLAALSEQDKRTFHHLTSLIEQESSRLWEFFWRAKLIGVLEGSILVCRVVSPLARAMLHSMSDELEQLAAQVYGGPMKFLYTPLAESDNP